MPEATALTAISSVARLLAPILNGIYATAQEAAKGAIQTWRAGENIDKVAEYYVRLASVKTIFSRDEAVPIDSFYYPSRVSFKLSKMSVDSLNDLPSGCIVVEGVVGQGKSIFMRHLALSILSDVKQKQIPVFIELRNISEKNSLRHLILKSLRAIGVSADDNVLRCLAEDGKIVLVLDGFDEIVGGLVGDTIAEINDLKNMHSNLRIIISSRPQNAIQNVAEFKVVKLQPLQTSDHDQFLKRLGVGSDRVVELVAAIRDSSQDIQDAISTPLMMSIVVLVYESVKQIPPYLSDFFSELFHVVFTQHDSLKEAFRRKHHTGLSENKLQHLFEAFCFAVMQKSYGRTLTTPKYNECFERALKYVPDAKCTSDDFRADIVGVACLMLEEGVGETTFLHKGILDYFAAAFVARFETPVSKNFYRSIGSDYRSWKVTLQFLGKIDEQRYLKFYYLKVVAGELKALTKVTESLSENSVKKYVIGLYEVARYSQRENGAQMDAVPNTRNELASFAADSCHYIISAFPVWNTDRKIFEDFALHSRKHINIGESVDFELDAALDLYGAEGLRDVLMNVEEEFLRRVEKAKIKSDEYDRRDAEIDLSFKL